MRATYEVGKCVAVVRKLRTHLQRMRQVCVTVTLARRMFVGSFLASRLL